VAGTNPWDDEIHEDIPVPEEAGDVKGGAHFRNLSVLVLCFLPAAFRESMMFCFVSICMRKQCLAVLYRDAVWVLYAALLCVL